MKIDAKTIEVNGVKYIPADSVQSLSEADCDGLRYAIIRCRDAGVHAGWVKHREGREVKLIGSRRLWQWHGKTLSGLATEGTTDASSCKYANEVPEIDLLDACEVIYCTDAGRLSIQAMREWVNE